MRNDPIKRLAAANPVPHDGPLHLPEPVRVRPVPLLLALAVALGALAGAGVAIAAALGAFDGISAANRPQTAADVLSPQTVATLTQNCTDTGAAPSFYTPNCHLVLDSSRLVSQLPDERNVYLVADTRQDLCVVIPEIGMDCGTSLTPSYPITASSFGDALDKPTILYGVALDSVNAVSFDMAGQEVTVPVKDNIWAYEGPPGETIPEALTAHFADGTTFTEHG